MSTRTIISIDEAKCNGCGLCIPNCPEGALQVIDGKARLVSDLFCDGLGACVGYCPEGAITLSEREAEPYDERRVMANIARQGANTIRAHFEHLDAHGEAELLRQATAFLEESGIAIPDAGPGRPHSVDRPAPGRATHVPPVPAAPAGGATLANWPIQLHLLSPMAPQLVGKDVLLSADCVAYACGAFHPSLLAGRTLAIACPKLDEGRDVYRDKLVALIDHARINTLTVAMMEVPCCRGLLALAQEARSAAHRALPVKAIIVSAQGAILSEEWVSAPPAAGSAPRDRDEIRP